MTAERDEKARALDSFEVTLNETISKLEKTQTHLAARTYTWTTARPTVAGWYWFKNGSAEVIVHVEIVNVDGYSVQWVWWARSRTPSPLNLVTGQWAGPILGPEEATR